MKIEIEAEDVTGKMFLREEIGVVTLSDGMEIEVTRTLPNCSFHFRIKDKSYIVSINTILEGILGELEKS